MKATETARGRGSQIRRRVAGLLRAILIYGLLSAGSVVFTLPFLWMVGSSFKVDREMFGSELTLWPQTPLPAKASPYLDARYYEEPDPEAFAGVRDAIFDALRRSDLGMDATVANRDEAVRIFAPGIYRRLRDTMPQSLWDAPEPDRAAAVRARITPDMIRTVRNRILRRLSLGPVRVRSFELQEKDLTANVPVSEFWRIEEGPARLVDRTGEGSPHADLVYDWSEGAGDKIVLSRTLDLPFRADRLFRVQISVTPDDSWHAIDFYLERGGKRYKGMYPESMGRFEARVVTLQEVGPMDAPDSNRIRLWIPYRQVAAGDACESRPDKVKVTMVMRRQGQLDAWWLKCIRNYRGALQYIPFWRYAATSAFLVVMNIIGNIFACSLVAYAFARLQWPGRGLSFGLMLATMMIPPQVTMIPYFLIMKHLGWYNTLNPLWIVSFFGNAFNIFLLRQFMKGIPRDMEDAARIDGCNFLQVYWFVIMPLIKPTLACIAIFTFMGVWNDFMGPLIFLADQRLYPLSLGLYAFNVQQGGDFGMMMAGSLLMTLPVIVIFFFAQKYFIQGITLTGAKG